MTLRVLIIIVTSGEQYISNIVMCSVCMCLGPLLVLDMVAISNVQCI